jgi:hypothetical protein
MENILIAGGYIDFYINQNKYDSYKTVRGRLSYVERELKKILNSLTGRVHIENDVDFVVRDANITSNNFWGNHLTIINDIGYSATNRIPMNEDHMTLRNFSIDIIGVSNCKNPTDHFFTISDDNFTLTLGNVKIV